MKAKLWTSMEVQWLRICLPMLGTQLMLFGVGQKVHLGFSLSSYGKIRMNFLANPYDNCFRVSRSTLHTWSTPLYLQDVVAAAAAKSLQLCLTLCNPIDGSPPGSPIPGILQARALEWVAISFSNAWKWKVKVKVKVKLCPTPHDPDRKSVV